MRHLFFIFSILFFCVPIHSQDTSDRLNIFIDCQMRCDFTYLRQEMTFVNFMRDRYESDVYILATRQRTGSGGDEIQLVFAGNQEFAGMGDTLLYLLSPDATDAIAREEFVYRLKQGLLPYLLKTSAGNNIEYTIKASAGEPVKEIIDDPWNFWVFNIGGNINFQGEASFKQLELFGRMSASRVTEASKFSIWIWHNYERGDYDLGEEDDFTSIIKQYNSRIRHVISIDDHWSAGYRTSLGSSTFGNTDLEGSIRPAIEYNIFPYGQAATKRFSFNYSIGPEYRNYTEVTVFDKLSETIIRHRLDIEFSQTQKWGELEIDAEISQFLHDPSLYSISINPNLEWQVMTGLSVDFGGLISFVGDRINIPKAELSDEEILLQIRQLDTDYSYFTYIGINYRFGSKFNNFVNPRF